MQHILAEIVTNIAHNNTYCYVASNRYDTQMQMQETHKTNSQNQL